MLVRTAHDRVDDGRLLPAVLVGLEAFIGLFAVYGAVMLIADAWQLPVTDLKPLPADGWLLPGMALLAFVAAPMLGAAVLVWLRHPAAAAACVLAGLLLVAGCRCRSR